MAGHRRAEATPSFGRLCPAMTQWCVASRLTIRKFAPRLSIQNHGVNCVDRGDHPLSAAAAGYVRTMGIVMGGLVENRGGGTMGVLDLRC
jgi:hypothetical protein